MKALVFSDTHGKIEKTIEICKSISHVDMVLHLGDLKRDADKIRARIDCPVLSVKGNMDGSYAEHEYQLLDTEFGKAFLSHGHMENVKQGYERFLYKAEFLGCKIGICGHTHIPVFTQLGDMYLLNPGSISIPLGGRKGSYAIVEFSENSCIASICYVDEENYRKSESSTLKDMLNNSDRF